MHWHGQTVPVDVDGAEEEGTPFVPARGRRRIEFTPGPAGLRFYHTHNRAGADLNSGQYSGHQRMDIDFVANNPGRTLFHCHQQLHMDFGFMAPFDYV